MFRELCTWEVGVTLSYHITLKTHNISKVESASIIRWKGENEKQGWIQKSELSNFPIQAADGSIFVGVLTKADVQYSVFKLNSRLRRYLLLL